MSLFSQRFKQLKEESNLTLKELADEFHISVATLSYYMNGREPNYDLLIEIAEYFDVTIDWLLGVSDARDIVHELLFEDVKKNASMNYNKELILSNQLDDIEETMSLHNNTTTPDNLVLADDDKQTFLKIQHQLYQAIYEIYYCMADPIFNSSKDLKDHFYELIQLSVKNFYEFFFLVETFVLSCYNDTKLDYNKALEYLKLGETHAELEKQLFVQLTYIFANILLTLNDDESILSDSEKKIFEEILNYNMSKFNINFSSSHLKEMDNYVTNYLLDILKKSYNYMTPQEIINTFHLY